MSQEDNSQLERNLLDTATNPDYADLLQEYAEVGLDTVIDSELVDAIPVVKTLVAISKGAATIQDRIFLKKLANFLSEANNLSTEERTRWYEKMKLEKPKKTKELAEKIMLMIEAANDNYKAAVIGKLFRAFAKGQIEKIDDFYYLVEIVDNCFTNVLKALAEGRDMTDESLFRAGIKHASKSPSASQIKGELDREMEMASRGIAVSRVDNVAPADYTTAGMMLINILRAP